jgi:hypothetical protein
VALERLDVLRNEELEDLIRQSYELVAGKALRQAAKQEIEEGKRSAAQADIAERVSGVRRSI